MNGIRQRLTLSYTMALAATLVVFGVLLYGERVDSSERQRQVQLKERLVAEAALIRTAIEEPARILPSVVVRQPVFGTGADSTTIALVADVRRFFDGLRDFLFVMDPSGRLLYASVEARSLSPNSLAEVRRTMLRVPVVRREGLLHFEGEAEPYRFLIDTISGRAADEVRSFLVAAKPSQPDSAPIQLVISMVLVAPLILLASAMLGYWLAGRALAPLDQIVAEVEAIQGGRSLHRRLAVPSGDDEFTRLGRTLNAMLERIERSFVALRRFTADASHELKTPLMVLRANVERSLTHPAAPDDVVDALDETLRQINEMTEMVTNLLTLARADEGRSSLVVDQVDLVPLVSEAAETAEILGEATGITVSLEVPDEPVQAVVDRGRIRQMMLNLATNAIKYTGEGGRVSIRLVREGERVVIEVSDTGIGIATGDLEHVFDRFWRADPVRSRTGDRPGVGLGLAIAKWVADAHDGTLSVQSRPGRGSTFTVTLPLE